MKKKFILAIFGVSLLFAACQQDSLCDDYVIDDQKSSVLREMKTLINDNYNAVTLLDWERTLNGNGSTRSGGECNSLMLTKEDFGFDWDNADVVTSNLAEAVIVPVKLNRDIALRSVVMEGNRRKKETTPIQSMLYACKIYKTGKTRAHILSFAPDRDYINECEEKGEEMKLCPNPQGSNFSGILFYSTIYGEVSHGIRYEHGRKRYYIIPRSERNIGFIEQYRSEHCDNHDCDSTHSHVKMAMEFITVSTATRSTYSNNSESTDMLICMFCGGNAEECSCLEIVACGVCKKDPCECEDIVEEKCEYCGLLKDFCECNNFPSWEDDGNSGSHGPNPGNPYPGGNIGGNSGGNSGNGGNANESTAINENLARITSKEFVKLNTNDISKLNNVIEQLIGKKGNHAKLFDWLAKMNPQITFQIGYTKDGPAIFNQNTITFKNSQAINFDNLIEEFIHAVQYNCCYESMDDKYSDFDLEAKMLRDMLCAESILCEDGLGGAGMLSQHIIAGGEEYAAEYDVWLYNGAPTNYMDYYRNLRPYFDYNKYDGKPSVFNNHDPLVLIYLYEE